MINNDDIRGYLRRELKSQLQKRPDAERLVEQILEKSEGVFLYIESFCEDIRRGYLSFDHPEEFPQGLGGKFFRDFQRYFLDLDKFRKEVRPALCVILAAREPLPLEILQRIFEWQDEEIRDFTGPLASLFPVTTEAGHEVIKPYHKSLAEWLTDNVNAGSYFVSATEGHGMLAQLGWETFESAQARMPAYFVRHLPEHLLLHGDRVRAALYYSAELDSAALTDATASLARHLLSQEGTMLAGNLDIVRLVHENSLDPERCLVLWDRYIHMLDGRVRDYCTVETRAALLAAVDEAVLCEFLNHAAMGI